MTGLTDDAKEEKVFIIVEKDYNGNYQLFYKKKFHCDASTMAEHLVAVMSKQYDKPILHIFNSYHQELAKEVVWNAEGILMHREEKELDEELEQPLDWVEIEELDAMSTTSLNKYALEEVDEMSVDTFGTEVFGISAKKTCKTLPSTSQSTRSP